LKHALEKYFGMKWGAGIANRRSFTPQKSPPSRMTTLPFRFSSLMGGPEDHGPLKRTGFIERRLETGTLVRITSVAEPRDLHTGFPACNTFCEQGFNQKTTRAKIGGTSNPPTSKQRGNDMKKWIALAALLLPISLAGCSHPRPVVVYAAAPPPPGYSEIAQHGYHDGFEAARRDIAQGKPPSLDRHPRFRNPPVPPPAFEDYRQGFRAGYDAYMRHGPPPPAGY
jgi:hypothetical protein